MRYIIGFLVSIGLLILVFVLIFRGGDDTAQEQQRRLIDYANSTTVVRMIHDHPINAGQLHIQYVTTVGRDQTTFTVERGYQGEVVRSQTYQNNPSAYANFLRALQAAGYTRGTDNPELRDERCYCPNGNRYIYEILQDNRTIQRFWSTSCGNPKTFEGNANTVRTLFRNQVPDYPRLITGINQR